MGQPESPSNQAATSPEQLLDLIRTRLGGNIEVFGIEIKEQIAHTTTDEISREACLLQCIQYA
jgi:hypothetical protein